MDQRAKRFFTVPLIVVLSVVVLGSAHSATGADNAAERAALAVMERFLATFNASDVTGLADTLAYPHVRFASGGVRIFENRAAFIEATDMAAFASNFGWKYSTWDDLEIIQSGSDKVHIRVRFSRFDAEDQLIASYDSLYVVVNQAGRWGIRARSSFAP